MELFGSTHAAHCFIYADYAVPRATIENELDHPVHGFRGYTSLARIDLTQKDVVPDGWTPHVRPDEVKYIFQDSYVVPYGFLEVLERQEEFDEDYGPKRIAMLFLGADGIATYDAIFCQNNGVPPPFGLVVMDYGFGAQYAKFGRGGLLNTLAARCYFRNTCGCR